jgi:hypothetical protein
MLMLQDASRQVERVVPAGNIVKLSLVLRQSGDVAPCKDAARRK